MATRNFVAVDLGAESGRTVVAQFDGSRVDLLESHRFPNGYVRVLDTMYWDILRLWQEIKKGLAASVEQAKTVHSIGIDTWGVDYGLIDECGRLVGNPVHYRDARTQGIFEHAFGIVPKQEIYERTGLQFLPFNTLLQLAAAFRERGPQAFAADKMLLVPDLLNFFLTGQKVAEYTIASTTQMLHARTGQWDTELVQRFSIPTSLLPEIVATGTTLGDVRSDVLAGGIPVIATAGHDTAAAVAAVPAYGEDWCYISSGTWSLMGVEVAEPVITEQTLADNFTNEGGYGGTIRLLKNIMGLWLVQECRRSLERSGQTRSYAELAELAEKAPPHTIVIDPDDPSFLNPPDMPEAIRAFCKRTSQRQPADVGGLIRTCLESLALRYRRTKEQLESHLGRALTKIHIVGGGCQNRLLCQLAADCTGCTVIAGPVEATALGNVLVQAIASGDLKTLDEGREVVQHSFPTAVYEPNLSAGPVWEEQYQRFISLIAR